MIKHESITRQLLYDIFDTNVFGALLLTNAVAPLLKKSKSPKIINITSELDSTDPWHKLSGDAYRMSKAALNMLTACQLVEFQDAGVKVWAFCPGYVVTDVAGDRESRKEKGAESFETIAKGILGIVKGKHDGEVGKFITKYGKQYPW